MRHYLLLILAAATGPAFATPALTVRVEGPGYLRFVREGRALFAKKAELTVVEGRLGEKGGAKIVPGIAVEATAKSVTVSLDGKVQVDGREAGRLVLALFSPEPATRDGLFSSVTRPELASPGEGECGVVRSESEERIAVYAPDPVPSIRPELTAPVPTSTNGRVQILLRDKSEVEAGSFTLGQIADLKCPPEWRAKVAEIEIGDAPPIGVDRIVDRNRIMARVKALGIDPMTVDLGGPERGRVVRKGQQVSHEQFVQAAVRGAELKGAAPGLQSVAPGPVMTVPMGELELVCESVSAGTGETSVTVGVYVDGRRFNSRTVKLRGTGAITKLKVGTAVTVHVTRGTLSVDAKGKVTQVDQSGGLVTVQIADTGAILTGTVRADGSVEVKG